MQRWQNKVAVVTGSSSGIGEACSKHLVAKGMIVVGFARRFERLQELKASLPTDQQSRFHPLRCDVSNEQEIIQAFAWIETKFGGVDVLVNNAGISRQTLITKANNGKDLRAIIDTNVMGVAYCTREAFQSMKKRNVDGHVVIINSITGHYVPNLQGVSLNIYPASKYALTAMTESLRQEFMIQETKIKITSISPGAVDTEIVPDGMEMAMLHADDIANAAVYCIQTPPHVQILEMIIKPIGELF